MRVLLALAFCLAVVAAAPKNPQRIIGGDLTSIDQYPSVASLLYSWNSVDHWQTCVGTIVNTRSVLTAAHCVAGDDVGRWKIRVGSSFANSDGTVHDVNRITVHILYDAKNNENDLAVVRSATAIGQDSNALPAAFAPANYNLPDGEAVWAAGWGYTVDIGHPSEQIRHVEIETFNQDTCIQRFNAEFQLAVTENMLCTKIPDGGGHDRCTGDDGGPLFHRGVVVGIYSWGFGCANDFYPSVNIRLSRYANWIHTNSAL